MKNKHRIPEALRSYSAAELHQAANAMDMESGKQPQLTLHSAFDKLKQHGVSLTANSDGTAVLVSDNGEYVRTCDTLSELMVALRIGPTFLEKPLFYRDENCTVVESTEKGFVIETEATGRQHFVWRDGAERVLSN